MEELELKDGMKVICPIKARNFTKGKEYVVYDVEKSLMNGFTFKTSTNSGKQAFCLLNGCSHLDYKNWIIKQ